MRSWCQDCRVANLPSPSRRCLSPGVWRRWWAEAGSSGLFAPASTPAAQEGPGAQDTLGYGRMNYKDTEPYMSAFLYNWPVNWICGIVFNRFYRLEIHSLMVGIFDPACELLPPWTMELVNCCPSTFSLTSPPLLPSQTKYTVYTIHTVCGCGGGGGCWIVLLQYSAGVLHYVSDQIQNLQNCFTTPNEMASKDDIKGSVSLKFLRPCIRIFCTLEVAPGTILFYSISQSTDKTK